MTMVSHKHHIWVSTHEGVSCLGLYTNSFEQYPIPGGERGVPFEGHDLCQHPNGLMRFDDSLAQFVPDSYFF
jgi:hypothetical protein